MSSMVLCVHIIISICDLAYLTTLTVCMFFYYNADIQFLAHAVDKNVGESADLDKGSDDPESAMGLLSWIFNNTKVKILDVIDKITGAINKLFLPSESEKTGKATDLFEDKLRTSLLISVVVLLIVVVTRASRA